MNQRRPTSSPTVSQCQHPRPTTPASPVQPPPARKTGSRVKYFIHIILKLSEQEFSRKYQSWKCKGLNGSYDVFNNENRIGSLDISILSAYLINLNRRE